MSIKIFPKKLPIEILKQVQNDNCQAIVDIPVMLNLFQHLLEN
jgi:hypothetical protein